MVGIYITHSEVIIDPDTPMPEWGLAPTGIARTQAFADKAPFGSGTRFISSTERKALETAKIIARGGAIECGERFGENDRSATGYLEPEAFEEHVTARFAHPEDSISGWESAKNTQARIVGAVKDALTSHDPEVPVVFFGHGCVGTLLKCHIGQRSIARSEDQHVMAASGGELLCLQSCDGQALMRLDADGNLCWSLTHGRNADRCP